MVGPEQAVKYVSGGTLILPDFNISTTRNIEVIDPQRVSVVSFAEIGCKHVSFGFLDALYNSIITSRNKAHMKKNGVILHTFPSYRIHLSSMNFGQWLDLEKLKTAFSYHEQQFSDTTIAYGVSRGAGCLFNALALRTIPVASFKGVILEGCFDAIEHVLDTTTTQFLHNLPKSFLKNGFKSVYKKYDSKGPRPIDLVEKYPLDIPTLFITSFNDRLVSPQLTINLFNQLKKLGHKSVYLAILQHSPHREYMKHEKDRSMYQAAVHAFYKICGIEHNSQWAQQGKNFLISEIYS